MNILLTGATGFVGSYFTKHYSDRYSIKTFSFLRHKQENLSFNNIHSVVHLAALVHQMGGASYEEYKKINVTQTLQLAKKAKESGVKHFIFMSSIKACGEESSYRYDETVRCKPQDEYGKTKLEAENLLLQLQDENFHVSIIRTPIIYGPGVKANIANLVKLVERVPLLPFGDINNKRSMIFIGNLCHIIDTLIQTQRVGIFFVADDTTLSTKEFIQMIAKVQQKQIRLITLVFFASLLKTIKPSFYKRLYESLEIDTSDSKQRLFGKNAYKLPYSVEDGIKIMIKGE